MKLAMAGAALAVAVLVAQPAPEARSVMEGSYIAVGQKTLVPYGWVDFCNRYSGECNTRPMAAQDVRLTPATMKIIQRVNTWVNTNIRPMSDQEQWGRVDRWDYPTTGAGDCEEYVLLKRKLLIEEGFPRQALLITVVKDQKGDGHAVLTVKTDKGELILDNLSTRVLPWTKVPYRFVKRQSQTDPNLWVDIGEPTAAPLTVSR
ncbi:MAG: transglutaminase [Alphaproteobacteria bacterium]|nr:transglutaminase [Alphaproteobacteria bacterium]